MRSKAYGELMRLFEVLEKLEDYSTKAKRECKTDTDERKYWQARADVSRTMLAEFRNSFDILKSKKGLAQFEKWRKTRVAF